ncbi:hypothetical protein GCM10022198_12520 [Klugiella xanthotipulae]|uniref:Peptidoglycan binding-like domain-containing protein n=1 Tax=Klugiella xanthotipulae TaxID=244735 RepID=A0A543I425_9MICO|nr:peptidoglycan-binding domain-containing protein [Klugiella xanthotipulae]TQM65338.1 hypothetical protein FB466_0135 [Klugiella xanthotipulae]
MKTKRKIKRAKFLSQKWSPRVGFLVFIAALGVGVILGLLLAPNTKPESLKPPSNVYDVSVLTRESDGARVDKVSVTLSPERDLLSPDSGVLVRSECTPGVSIRSGEPIFTIDNESIVALYTDLPLWRDLNSGDTGEDVSSLQRELIRLGFNIIESGRFDFRTSEAVRKLIPSHDNSRQYALQLSRFIWLPSPELTISSCANSIGDLISVGQSLATSGNQLTSIKLTENNQGDGSRVVTAGGIESELTENGTITDRAFLDAYSETPEFIQWRANQSQGLTVKSHLKTPIHSVTVPSSALFMVDGRYACIIGNGKSLAVTIIGSELGKTFVTADNLPSQVSIRPFSDEEKCR